MDHNPNKINGDDIILNNDNCTDNATDDLEQLSFVPKPQSSNLLSSPVGLPPAAAPPFPPTTPEPSEMCPANVTTSSLQGKNLFNPFNDHTNDHMSTGNGIDMNNSQHFKGIPQDFVMGGSIPENRISTRIGKGPDIEPLNDIQPPKKQEDEQPKTATTVKKSKSSHRKNSKKSNSGRYVAGTPNIQSHVDSTTSESAAASRAKHLNTNVNASGITNQNPVPNIIFRIRICNILLSVVAIGLTISGLIGKVVTMHVTQLVFSVYAIFFSGLLFCFELHTSFLSIESRMRDNFGILFTPKGRSCFLLLWGSIVLIARCGGLIESIIIGLLIISEGIYTIWVVMSYPEYVRQWQNDNYNQDISVVISDRVGIPAWASPFNRRGDGGVNNQAMNYGTASSEAQGLLEIKV